MKCLDQGGAIEVFAELKPVIFIDDDAGDIVDDAFRSLSLDGADDKCGCAEPLLTPVAAQIETDRAQGIRVGKNQRLQRGLELLLLDVVLMSRCLLTSSNDFPRFARQPECFSCIMKTQAVFRLPGRSPTLSPRERRNLMKPYNIAHVSNIRRENIPLIATWIIYYAWVIIFTTWWAASALDGKILNAEIRTLLHTLNLFSAAAAILLISKANALAVTRFSAVLLFVSAALFFIAAGAFRSSMLRRSRISGIFSAAMRKSS